MDTCGIIAPKQYGKTTLIKQLIRSVPKERIFVLDTNHEYLGFPNRVIPKSYNLFALNSFINFARKGSNRLVIIDDLDVYIDATPSEELKTLMVNGSHQNIGFIYAVKRPVGLPKICKTEAEHLFVANVDDEKDKDSLKGYIKNMDALNTIPRFSFLYRNRSTREEKIISVSQ